MTIQELSRELEKRYAKAKINEASLQVHLFGIDYGQVIKENGYKYLDIVEGAGLSKGYITELSKGVNLSAYVKRK